MFEKLLEDVEKGDTLVSDIDPIGPQERGKAFFEVDRIARDGDVYVTNGEDDNVLGAFEQSDGGGIDFTSRRNAGAMSERQKIADINDVTTTRRDDLDPVEFQRASDSGRFTPTNVESDPSVPTDRGPNGQFVSKERRPVIDIGRERTDGLFDRF